MAPSSGKKNTQKKPDKAAAAAAAAAAAEARKQGPEESDEAYKARIAELDASESEEEEAPASDGLVPVRAVSGFHYHTHVSEKAVEAQRPQRHNETDEAHRARMVKLDAVKTAEPTEIRRGLRFRVEPDEAARLARLGLVTIGDSDEMLADRGPKVLTETGIISQNSDS